MRDGRVIDIDLMQIFSGALGGLTHRIRNSICLSDANPNTAAMIAYNHRYPEREAAAAHNPGERIPSSLVNKICGFDFDINLPIFSKQKGAVNRSQKAPSARLEHATYCSASKRSNPLSYEGMIGRRGF